ncbi:MAG: hypothetical protein ACR2OG_07125 [Gemmatimonadaceae bacterium]
MAELELVRPDTVRRVPLSLSLFAATVGGALALFATEALLVSGTYQKGSNITEPRPKKSEFLQTLQGGIAVIGDKAGYYLFTRVIKKPDKDLYIRIEFEDPAGGPPLTDDTIFRRDAEEFHFSTPQFVKGLRNYSDYMITVNVFESRGAGKPIDILRQTVRSYVDTRGSKAKMFNRLKQKS